MKSQIELNISRAKSYQNILTLDTPCAHWKLENGQLKRQDKDDKQQERDIENLASQTLPLLNKSKEQHTDQGKEDHNYENHNQRENDQGNGSTCCYTPPPGALQRAPSQVTMHYTTVPQSLVSRQLGSRHHPTRSSLRRSRLLVLVQNGTVPRKYLPGVVEKEKLGIVLNLTQLILGIIATGLAVWRVVRSNNISREEDWPYYSSLLILTSGWFGLILLLNCRYLYPGVSHHPCILPIRTYHIVCCVVLTSLGAVSSLVSSICFILQILTYSYSSCQDALITKEWSIETCVCLSSRSFWRNGELVYPSTNCKQVAEYIPPFLWSLFVINFTSFFAALGFLLLITSSQHVSTFKAWRKHNKNNNNTKQSNMEGNQHISHQIE